MDNPYLPKSTLQSKLSTAAIMLCAGILSVMISVSTVWHLYPPEGIVVNGIRIMDSEVHPGQYMMVNYDVKRNNECRIIAQRFIQDSTNRIIAIDNVSLGLVGMMNKEKTSGTTVGIKIPDHITPGNWRLYSTFSYKCNPMQNDIIVTPEPVSFVVQ